MMTSGQLHDRLRKRRAAQELSHALIARGMSPERISAAVHWRRHNSMWTSQPGELDGETFLAELRAKAEADGRKRDPRRYWFWQDDELIHHDGTTWAGTKRWGVRTIEAIQLALDAARDQLGEEVVAGIGLVTYIEAGSQGQA